MDNNDILDLTASSAWSERVYIETSEHIIIGNIFMPKIGKKTRLISEALNGGKNFLAVKDCTVEYKLNTTKPLEKHDFMQVNIASILIIRPLSND